MALKTYVLKDREIILPAPGPLIDCEDDYDDAIISADIQGRILGFPYCGNVRLQDYYEPRERMWYHCIRWSVIKIPLTRDQIDAPYRGKSYEVFWRGA